MISSVGSAAASQVGSMQMRGRPSAEEVFNKLDADGSGGLDETELRSMIDRMSEKMGAEGPSAEELMADLDSDGDGVLSAGEFEAGRPQGPPPGPPPQQQMQATTQSDLESMLLDLFSAGEEAEEASMGILV